MPRARSPVETLFIFAKSAPIEDVRLMADIVDSVLRHRNAKLAEKQPAALPASHVFSSYRPLGSPPTAAAAPARPKKVKKAKKRSRKRTTPAGVATIDAAVEPLDSRGRRIGNRAKNRPPRPPAPPEPEAVEEETAFAPDSSGELVDTE